MRLPGEQVGKTIGKESKVSDGGYFCTTTECSKQCMEGSVLILQSADQQQRLERKGGNSALVGPDMDLPRLACKTGVVYVHQEDVFLVFFLVF